MLVLAPWTKIARPTAKKLVERVALIMTRKFWQQRLGLSTTKVALTVFTLHTIKGHKKSPKTTESEEAAKS